MDVTFLSPRVAAWILVAVLTTGAGYGGWELAYAAAHWDINDNGQITRLQQNTSENEGKLAGLSLYGKDPGPAPTNEQIEAAVQRYLTDHAGKQSSLSTLRGECKAASAVAITAYPTQWLRGCREGDDNW